MEMLKNILKKIVGKFGLNIVGYMLFSILAEAIFKLR